MIRPVMNRPAMIRKDNIPCPRLGNSVQLVCRATDFLVDTTHRDRASDLFTKQCDFLQRTIVLGEHK